MTNACVVCILLVTGFYLTKCEVDIKRHNDTVVLVHVLFRHGERTPDPNIYPKDPYKNEEYYPFGKGQLTTEGTVTCYNLGRMLRRRYNEFLGKIYTPNILYARTTFFDRTKSSVQAVLTGLFPPKGVNRWSPKIKWQPIPFVYFSEVDDEFLRVRNFSCAAYVVQYMDSLLSPEVEEIRMKSQRLYAYISKHTGKCITRPFDAYFIYFHLAYQKLFGLTLPSWTKKIYPDAFEQIIRDEVYLSTKTPKLVRLSIGQTLKKIVGDTYAVIEGNETVKGRKLYLYSAHGTNVAFLLSALRLSHGVYPLDGSNLIFEVSKEYNVYYMRVYYQEIKTYTPKLLTIPGCSSSRCPLEEFVEVLKDHISTDTDIC